MIPAATLEVGLNIPCHCRSCSQTLFTDLEETVPRPAPKLFVSM